METILIVSSVLLWILMLFNLLLTLALIRRYNTTSGTSHTAPPEGLPAGTKAPAFSANTLDGGTVTLADYINTGRSTLLIFAAPGCQPCQELIPSLKAIEPHARQAGVDLVLVTDAGARETETWKQEMGLPFSILTAPRHNNSFFNDYKANMTPAYCLLSEQGVIQSAGLPGQYSPQWTALTEAWAKQASLT